MKQYNIIDTFETYQHTSGKSRLPHNALTLLLISTAFIRSLVLLLYFRTFGFSHQTLAIFQLPYSLCFGPQLTCTHIAVTLNKTQIPLLVIPVGSILLHKKATTKLCALLEH